LSRATFMCKGDMNRNTPTTRHGLTVLEFVLALTVTAMVAVGVTGMLSVVSTGVGTRADTRTVMVQADAARRRLGAYVDPARCLLDAKADGLTIWLNDARESGTVHATEIRWIIYDSDADTLDVSYVKFPDSWTDFQKDTADMQYPSNADWDAVRTTYAVQGHLTTITIVDGLTSFSFSKSASDPMDAEHMTFELGIETSAGSTTVQVPATIRLHRVPIN